MTIEYTDSSYHLAWELERTGAIAGLDLTPDPIFPVEELYNCDQDRMIAISTELDENGMEHLTYTVYHARDKDLLDPLTMRFAYQRSVRRTARSCVTLRVDTGWMLFIVLVY